MSKIIYKFPLISNIGEIEIITPYKIIKPLCAGLDPKNQISVWLELDKSENIKDALIYEIIGTGRTFNHNFKYLNSFVEGVYFWHFYYKI